MSSSEKDGRECLPGQAVGIGIVPKRSHRTRRALAAAYGWADWTPALSEDEILRRLLALNRARATE
jgi:hypothetical protein